MANLDHPILIEPLPAEDGGGFVATVPDLPGCMSDGDTPEEAIAMFAMRLLRGSRRPARWVARCPSPGAVTLRPS